MEGERGFLTFQAVPLSRLVFTNNIENVYFPINQTMILFDYNSDELVRTEEEYGKLDIRTMEDFNANMAMFAAKPNFKLSLCNNMPCFKKYIVKLDNKVVEARNEQYYVNLKEGLNTPTVAAVNQNGTEGIPTTVSIKYE